jgi:hypothetical protein
VVTVFSGGAATATPPQRDGRLTLSPATGTDTTTGDLVTDSPCPAVPGDDSFYVSISGPNGFFVPIVSNTNLGFSTTSQIHTQFSVTVRDASQLAGKPIVAGEYDLELRCVSGDTGQIFKTFTTAMFFTIPYNYQVTNPNPGAVQTTIVLQVTPNSPAAGGTTETLTAMVSPPTTVGTVQFNDAADNLLPSVFEPAPLPVSGGTVTITRQLRPAPHQLFAVFTPTDPAAFGQSTSLRNDYTVNLPPKARRESGVTTSTPTPPGVDPQAAVGQFAGQRDDAGRGPKWVVLAGAVLSAVLVAGVVIVVVARTRRRHSS